MHDKNKKFRNHKYPRKHLFTLGEQWKQQKNISNL